MSAEALERVLAFLRRGADGLVDETEALPEGTVLRTPSLPGCWWANALRLEGPHPGVLRLVEQVVAGAARHGRSVSVCGELGGDPVAAVLLVGLGVRRLSAAAPRIPEVKAALREVTLADAQEAARAALDAEDPAGAAAAAAPLLQPSQAPSR